MEESEDTNTNTGMNRKLGSLSEGTENSDIIVQQNEKEKINFENVKNLQEVPILYVRSISYLSLSIISYLIISICLALFGLKSLKKINFDGEEQLIYQIFFIIGGILEYIIGIYDWYRGDSFLFFVQLSLGLLFLNHFHSPLIEEFIGPTRNEKGEILIPSEEYYNCGWERIEGTFYLLFLFMFICILVCAKKKSIIHSFNYLSLCVGFIFLFVYKYQREVKHWSNKVFGYSSLIGGGLFWLTGFFGFIQELFKHKNLSLI